MKFAFMLNKKGLYIIHDEAEYKYNASKQQLWLKWDEVIEFINEIEALEEFQKYKKKKVMEAI